MGLRVMIFPDYEIPERKGVMKSQKERDLLDGLISKAVKPSPKASVLTTMV